MVAPTGEEVIAKEDEVEAMRKELERAQAEIRRLNAEIAAQKRRSDVFAAIAEFRENMLERFDWKSLQSTGSAMQNMLQIPLVPPRKRQAFAASLPFASLPLAYLLTFALLWIALFRDSSYLVMAALLAYFGHIYLDKSPERGGKLHHWMRESMLWRHMADYFPVELRKMNPDTEFPAGNVYMFGYHPHGIISVGCFVNFATSATGFKKLFPGIDIRLGTLEFNLKVPFFREWLLRMGIISTCAEEWSRLGSGHCARWCSRVLGCTPRCKRSYIAAP
mmetsp:Transcript_110463/g.219604  ORF Transcript_110463/g.219604 Transcript_110463/m.219604 type:complete len:277 (+) Transcript_110463:76-906(+)